MGIRIVRSLSLIGVALFAGSALMQGAAQGRFHLATEAHLGKWILTPGDYTVTFPEPVLGRIQVKVEGAGKTIYALPLVTDGQPYSNSSYLKLAVIGGEYFVTQLSSGSQGKSYTFSAPKSNRHLMSKGSDDNVSLEVK